MPKQAKKQTSKTSPELRREVRCWFVQKDRARGSMEFMVLEGVGGTWKTGSGNEAVVA